LTLGGGNLLRQISSFRPLVAPALLRRSRVTCAAAIVGAGVE
jgi:hypothetical protein